MDASKYEKERFADYRALSDADFVRNLDLLASHYHSDYMQGRGMLTANVDSFFSRNEDKSYVAPVYPKEPPRTMNFVGYYTRRTFFLFLILVFSIVELVYVGLSYLKISFVEKYLYMFGDKVSFVDGFLGAIGQESALSSLFSGDEKIFGYAIAAFSVLYVLLSLIAVITSVCALCAKRKEDGTYKKIGFGWISIAQVACALGIVICALIGDLKPVYTGCVFVTIVPLLTLDFSILSYKKRTISVPETAIDKYGRVKKDYLDSVI